MMQSYIIHGSAKMDAFLSRSVFDIGIGIICETASDLHIDARYAASQTTL